MWSKKKMKKEKYEIKKSEVLGGIYEVRKK